MALEAQANVEEIPSYAVKTPLQQAVQILKRHRDVMFAGRPEHKPISVIITTLAGLSYFGERTAVEAVLGILQRMESHISFDPAGNVRICNPTDPQENFADRWQNAPEKRASFYAWLRKVREDISLIAAQQNLRELSRQLASRSANVKPAPQAEGRQTIDQSRKNLWCCR